MIIIGGVLGRIRKVKRLLCVFMTIILVLFSGCATNKTNKTSKTDNSNSTVSTVDGSSNSNDKAESNMNEQGLPILKEKKTYVIAVEKDPKSENGFADKEASKKAEEATNIHIDWMDIPAAGWDEQVNIMIASGNLPDAFCSSSGVDTMSNIELFTPISSLIEKYAPNINEMLTTDTKVKMAITAEDGEIYSLPTGKDSPAKKIGHSLWMNTEWLSKLGLSIPKTTDEFVDVLRAFKNGDPNGNGIADEIPFLAGTHTSESTIYPMFGSFGVVENDDHVISLDGKTVIFTGTQPGYFEALKWLHSLYSEGLLDNEIFTHDAAQVNAKGQSKDMIIGSILLWSPDSIDPRFAEYEILEPLKGPDGTQLWSINREPLGQMEGFAITKNCDDPEVLVRYYDYNISSLEIAMSWMYGPEFGGTWKRSEDRWEQTTEYVTEGSSLSYMKFTVAGGDRSPMYQWSKYSKMEIPDARNKKKLAGIDLCLPYAVTVMPNGVENPERMNQRNLLFVDINNYMKKFMATSIVDGIDEAGWQNHLKTCEQLKVNEYTNLWQQYFDMKKGS